MCTCACRGRLIAQRQGEGGGGLRAPSVRYLLPFTAEQVRSFLDHKGVPHSGELPLEVLENPLVLRLYASAWRVIKPSGFRGAVLRRDVYNAFAEQWLTGVSVLSEDVRTALSDAASGTSFAELFADFAESAALRMFSAGALVLPAVDMAAHPWAQLPQLTRESAERQFAGAGRRVMDLEQLVRARLRVLQRFLSGSPVQGRGEVLTFFHKSLRDFYCARALLRQPDCAARVLTDDPAVLRFAAEMVDIAAARERLMAASPPPAADGTARVVDGLLRARHCAAMRPYPLAKAVVAANCASVLAVAGVSLSGVDLSGAALGEGE
jgi:hypothetical protein